MSAPELPFIRSLVLCDTRNQQEFLLLVTPRPTSQAKAFTRPRVHNTATKPNAARPLQTRKEAGSGLTTVTCASNEVVLEAPAACVIVATMVNENGSTMLTTLEMSAA